MMALFLFEVKYYFKNIKEAIQIIALFLSIVILYPFSQNGAEFSYQGFASSILWIALIMAINLGANTLFQRDRDAGRLEYYQLTNLSLEKVMFAKWLSYYLSIMVPLCLVMPLAGILMNVPVDSWLHYAAGLAAGALPLSMIAALVSVMMAGLDKSGAMLSLIILPLTIPVIIFGSSYSSASGEEQQASLLFLFGFSVFLLPILAVAGASCIKASN